MDIAGLGVVLPDDRQVLLLQQRLVGDAEDGGRRTPEVQPGGELVDHGRRQPDDPVVAAGQLVAAPDLVALGIDDEVVLDQRDGGDDDAGLDAVELSGGLLTGGKLSPSRANINKPEKEAYFQQDAVAFKKQIEVPLILVGGNRSFQVAQRLVDDGVTEYISICRPLIREPGLINRWKSGDRSRATCLSDNMCFGSAREGCGIYCVTEEKLKRNA